MAASAHEIEQFTVTYDYLSTIRKCMYSLDFIQRGSSDSPSSGGWVDKT